MPIGPLAVYHVGFLIKSPTTYKQWRKKEAHLHPTGMDAFKLGRWEQNQVIVLEKTPDYFRSGLPYVDRIEYKIMKEEHTHATALRAGEVDFVNYVPKERVERLDKDPRIRMFKGLDIQGLYVSFNNSKTPFDDVRVRQALRGYGIDRHAIAKIPWSASARRCGALCPAAPKDHIDFEEQFPYNPEKAKALLKEAGFDEKNPLKYSLMCHTAEPLAPTISTIIKTQLARIGVKATAEVIDGPIFIRGLPPIATGISSSPSPTPPSMPIPAPSSWTVGG